MRMTSYLFVLLVASILLGTTSILVLPSTVDYSVFNEGESGFSKLLREYGGKIVTNTAGISSINPSASIIITSNNGLASPSIAENYVAFVEKGGILVVTGDSTYLNSLAKAFGLPEVASGKIVYDMVYNQGDRYRPVGYSRLCNCDVSLWRPYASNVSGENVLIETSPLSYLDVDGDGFLDLDEPIGVFPVGVAYKYYNGTVFFILSPRVFTNDMLEFNGRFLECLKGNRFVYIDQITQSSRPFERLRFVAFQGGDAVFAGVLAVIIVVVMLYAHGKK